LLIPQTVNHKKNMVKQHTESRISMSVASSRFYVGATVHRHGDIRSRDSAAPVTIEMTDGAGVLATCRRLGDDKLLLAVDEWCTAKETWIVSRLWTLRATNASLSDWIVAEKGKAAIESVTSSGGQWSAQGLFAPFSFVRAMVPRITTTMLWPCVLGAFVHQFDR
jgi:hypothetical protein